VRISLGKYERKENLLKKKDQQYRAGIWIVKPGKAQEFIKTWTSQAEWLIEHHPDVWKGEAILLQDIQNSNKFLSFAWSAKPEKTEELLLGDEFRSFMADIQELCEEVQPHRMRLAVSFASHPGD
jgi:hypothetical protein